MEQFFVDLARATQPVTLPVKAVPVKKSYPVGGSPNCKCGRKFGTYRERLLHLHDHANPAQVRCRCGQVFGTVQGLKLHQRKCPAMLKRPKQLLNL